MKKTYPKKTGLTDFDGVVYYLEDKIEEACGSAVSGNSKDIFPPIPKEEGEYTLTLIVEDGVPALIWEESV